MPRSAEEPITKVTLRMGDQVVLRAKYAALAERVSLSMLIERVLDKHLPKVRNLRTKESGEYAE